MDKQRKIPAKNYLLLILLFAVTIFIVAYLANAYKAREEYKLKNSTMGEIVEEIKTDEVSNYIIDNPNIMIYFSSTIDKKVKKFEKEFRKYIVNEELSTKIIYVDTNEIKTDEFYNDFSNRYFDKELTNKSISLKYIPNMVVLKDGKVTDVLITYNENINLELVEEFVNENDIDEQ